MITCISESELSWVRTKTVLVLFDAPLHQFWPPPFLARQKKAANLPPWLHFWSLSRIICYLAPLPTNNGPHSSKAYPFYHWTNIFLQHILLPGHLRRAVLCHRRVALPQRPDRQWEGWEEVAAAQNSSLDPLRLRVDAFPVVRRPAHHGGSKRYIDNTESAQKGHGGMEYVGLSSNSGCKRINERPLQL